MAEFMNQQVPRRFSKKGSGDGFDQMGKPIPIYRRTAALHHCHDMGLTDPEQAWAALAQWPSSSKRDQPYEAIGGRHALARSDRHLLALKISRSVREAPN